MSSHVLPMSSSSSRNGNNEDVLSTDPGSASARPAYAVGTHVFYEGRTGYKGQVRLLAAGREKARRSVTFG